MQSCFIAEIIGISQHLFHISMTTVFDTAISVQ